MTETSDHRLPTLEDAHRAADTLRDTFDPGEILLFGSVASGCQQATSDLDLVLIFDDLGDYSQRRNLVNEAREIVAETTGLACDIRVTDRPEWEVRTKQCLSTFEAHIISHAVTLSMRPPRNPINWRKEIGMAPSDERQAAYSLANTTHALNGLLQHLNPSDYESGALLSGDVEYAKELEHSRRLNICAQSQTVMETSLKALIHALKGPHPAKVHDIGGLIASAGSQLDPTEAEQLESCLGQIKPNHASVWREASTYPEDRHIEGDPIAATPAFASRMATAAVQTTRTCVSLISAQLGYLPDEARRALARCQSIEAGIPNPDPR